MNIDLSNTVVMFALATFGMGYVTILQRRSAREVLRSLCAEHEVGQNPRSDLNWFTDPRNQKEASSLSPKDIAKKKKLSAMQVGLALALPLISYLSGHATPSGLIALFCGGFCLGYLVQKMRVRTKEANYNRSLDFFLPIVMERVSMAVQSGLDIISGIKAVLELDRLDQQKNSGGKGKTENNPVTDLLSTVIDRTEGGLGFAQSLREVAKKVESTGLKHSFIHLALAHQEGGELAVPLRELSDATQLYYQETIEEEIAKLPVKATMPLLLTFAGLIVCFITSPMIQILQMTAKAMPGH
jgi:pilus assembly protein TadC